MKWQGTPAVVTGACGFIGSHLVESLVRKGASIKALAFYDARGGRGWLDELAPAILRQVEIVSGDVRDADMMRRLIAPGDVVFHLAALIGIPYSYEAPRSYVDTNVTGTLNILEAARAADAARVLVVSTSEVYGTALKVPIAESHPLQAQSPYAASKIAAEKLAESYGRSFGLPTLVVRPFNTYGPRQSLRAVIPTLLAQLLGGRRTVALGDTSTTRDFNFVEDTVTGLIQLAACEAAIGRVVNIGTGVDVSIRQVAETAGDLLGKPVKLRVQKERLRPRDSEVRRLCADNSLLKALTGWAPPARLREGLAKTATWLKERLERYDPERYYK